MLWDIGGQSLGTVLMAGLLSANRSTHFITIWSAKQLAGSFRVLFRLTLHLSHQSEMKVCAIFSVTGPGKSINSIFFSAELPPVLSKA